jgi:hypothetical protein
MNVEKSGAVKLQQHAGILPSAHPFSAQAHTRERDGRTLST